MENASLAIRITGDILNTICAKKKLDLERMKLAKEQSSTVSAAQASQPTIPYYLTHFHQQTQYQHQLPPKKAIEGLKLAKEQSSTVQHRHQQPSLISQQQALAPGHDPARRFSPTQAKQPVDMLFHNGGGEYFKRELHMTSELFVTGSTVYARKSMSVKEIGSGTQRK